jgi:AraC-like DNA-binding protein
MNIQLLHKHRFQFISFAPCFYDRLLEDYGRVEFHDDSHLFHITRGTGSIIINHKRYELKRGTVIAIPPFMENKMRYTLPFEMLNLHYRVWLENGDLLDDNAMLPTMFRPEYFNDIEKILYRMKASKPDKYSAQTVLAGAAHEVVLRHLCRHLIVQNKKTVDSRIQKGYLLLSSPDYHHFDAKEIAAACSLSKSQMTRMFRRCFRLAPHEYWEKRRFAHIRSLLIKSNQTVKQISSEFGFDDMAYFSRWFKKMSGRSPAEFMKRQGSKYAGMM